MSDVVWMMKASESNLQLLFKTLTNNKSYFKSYLNNKVALKVLNFSFSERENW